MYEFTIPRDHEIVRIDVTKQELETKNAKKKTLGRYVFNQEKKCFLGDAEIELCIAL